MQIYIAMALCDSLLVTEWDVFSMLIQLLCTTVFLLSDLLYTWPTSMFSWKFWRIEFPFYIGNKDPGRMILNQTFTIGNVFFVSCKLLIFLTVCLGDLYYLMGNISSMWHRFEHMAQHRHFDRCFFFFEKWRLLPFEKIFSCISMALWNNWSFPNIFELHKQGSNYNKSTVSTIDAGQERRGGRTTINMKTNN